MRRWLDRFYFVYAGVLALLAVAAAVLSVLGEELGLAIDVGFEAVALLVFALVAPLAPAIIEVEAQGFRVRFRERRADITEQVDEVGDEV